MKKILLKFVVCLMSGGMFVYLFVASLLSELAAGWTTSECLEYAAYITLLGTFTISCIVLPLLFREEIRDDERLRLAGCMKGYPVPPNRCRCLSERITIRKVAGDKDVFYQCPDCGQPHNRVRGKEPHATHYGDDL